MSARQKQVTEFRRQLNGPLEETRSRRTVRPPTAHACQRLQIVIRAV